jgi:hypothetical protein
MTRSKLPLLFDRWITSEPQRGAYTAQAIRPNRKFQIEWPVGGGGPLLGDQNDRNPQ